MPAPTPRPGCERGLELARREGLAGAEALCVYTLGVARWILGDLEGADALLAESLERFRAVDDPDERITSPLNISDMRGGAGDPAGLRVCFEETLQPFIEVTCSAATGYVLANQASIARMRGDQLAAEALLVECAEHFAALDDERGESERPRPAGLPRAAPKARSTRRGPASSARSRSAPR